MQMIIIGIFLSVIVSAHCHIEAPKKCCFDEELEGYYGSAILNWCRGDRLAEASAVPTAMGWLSTKGASVIQSGSVGSVQGGSVQGVTEFLQFGYDFKGQRYGTDGYVQTSAGLSVRVKTIQLWKENTQYTIVNDVCTTAPLVNGSEPTKCVPADATFDSYFVEGKNEIDLQLWQRSIASDAMNGTISISVSNKTCAPVGNSFMGSVDSGAEHILMTSNGGYFNLTEGIKDPKKWFSVPRACQHDVTNLKIKRDVDEASHSIINLLRKIPFLSF